MRRNSERSFFLNTPGRLVCGAAKWQDTGVGYVKLLLRDKKQGQCVLLKAAQECDDENR